jgi:hypothetical protein
MKKVKKSISATLYPDKILIVTMNHKDDYTKYSTDRFVLLPIDSSHFILGESVIKYLQNSKREDISFDEMGTLYSSLKKSAKFKSEKAIMLNARRVTVDALDEAMNFVPWKNMITDKGQREYYRIPEGIVSIANTEDFSIIGKHLRDTWENCLFA